MKYTLILFALLTCSTSLGQKTYTLLKQPQTLTWIGKAAIGNYAPEGTLSISSATLTIQNDSITAFSIKIDMTTLHHDNKQLRKHLRSEDFFEVKKYGVASFTLQKTVAIKQNKVQLIGTLKIKNKQMQESILVNLERNQENIMLSFNQEFNRLDYGITHNSPSIFKSLKENAIADTFVLHGKIIFGEKTSY